MGYGHQRAAYPLKDLVQGRIIIANNDPIVPDSDTLLWERARMFYETVSRLKEVPIVGRFTFDMYDKLQHISPFFPFRDLSAPTYSVRRLQKLIKKRGFPPILSLRWYFTTMAERSTVPSRIRISTGFGRLGIRGRAISPIFHRAGMHRCGYEHMVSGTIGSSRPAFRCLKRISASGVRYPSAFVPV